MSAEAPPVSAAVWDWHEPEQGSLPPVASDADLMVRVRAGDRSAFGEVVDRYKGNVVGYLTRLTGNRDRAEDFAQETFVRLFETSPRYREEGRLGSWLFTVATNLVRTAERRERRRSLLRLDFFRGTSGPGPVSPQAELLGAERHELLTWALAELPLEFREAVVLFDLEGWSYREIAAESGVREGTVKSRLSRGRARLRKLLAPYKLGDRP